jgi:dTDP-3,4-didehydro-2,6-dideoxy-alpha-D-glucose 3-reductase
MAKDNHIVRIGVMGCASIAQRLMIPAILQLPGKYQLVAVASRDKSKSAATAAAFNTEAVTGYDNLLDRSDIDAIYMPLPTGLHREWITKSLQAGKHVFAEKSLAMNRAEAQALVALAKEKQLLLMENFMFRYHAQHQWVLEQLKQQSIGELRLFRSQFGFPPLDGANFRYDAAAGGGALLDAAAYTVKASQWFLGKQLTVMAATLYIDPAKQVDLYGNASLINEKGQVAQLGFGFDNFYQCNYELWGSKGRIFAERAFTPKPAEQPFMLLEKQGDAQKLAMPADNHFVRILEAFHNSIINRQHTVHLDEILEQSSILTAIRETAIKIQL